MQIPQDPHHPTIIKGGPQTTMKGLQPVSPKQQALRKVTTVVRSTGMLYIWATYHGYIAIMVPVLLSINFSAADSYRNIV